MTQTFGNLGVFIIIQTRLPNSTISLLQILQIKPINLVKVVKTIRPNPWDHDYAISIKGKNGH